MEAKLRAVPITDANTVQSVIEKFREKVRREGCEEVLCRNFDVAVVVEPS